MEQTQTARKLILKAPLSGYLVPIERVSDPVFSQKLVGDGMALDPTSQSLLAPCDGQVVNLHAAGHALTLLTEQNIEVLIHIGLDTIYLKGEGFSPKVKQGERVRAGTPLIDFEADFVATHAKSLLTMIVVANHGRVAAFERATGMVTAGRDIIMELTLAADTDGTTPTETDWITSEAILVANPTGLHARPAAVLANLARKYRAEIRVQRGDDTANAKSITSLMGLDLRYQDKINLVAQGPDARLAIDALTAQIQSGLGEVSAAAPAPAGPRVAEMAEPAPLSRSEDPNLLRGVTASPGLSAGAIFQVQPMDYDLPENASDPQSERLKLQESMDKARQQLEALQVQLQGQADVDKAAIFAAHREVLDDPELRSSVQNAILKGKSAAFAWHQTIHSQAERLMRMPNGLLAARAADLRDVGRRVLQNLTGMGPRRIDAPEQSILIAEEFTPSDTANLDRSKVLGFCTTLGSATSHMAIIARSLDIPAVAGIEPRALEIPDFTPAILDGTRGILRINPSSEEMDRLKEGQQKLAARKKADLEHANLPAVTLDGHRIEVGANIGGPAEARRAVSLGAEGVGLLRTEFLFLNRETAPTEDEQTQVYSEIARALEGRPLVIRTLDVGGDKPLPYLPIPREENPMLGERGLRVGLNRPAMLRTQLRAILRAAGAGRVLVMFPMVATLTEWRMAKAIFNEESGRLGVGPIPVGLMIEIPSAAAMAEQFAREADFFSIGTNDLTQYTLAMDRGHAKLAPQVDGLNPGVLHLIGQATQGAGKHGRWVGVCGGMAGDPQAIPILIGLGVRELSVSVPALPAVKSRIRTLSLAECQELAQKALTLDSAQDVRALIPDPSA